MTIEIELGEYVLTFADLKVGEAFKYHTVSGDVLLKVASNDFLHKSGREANSVSLMGAPTIYNTHPKQKVVRVTLKCKVAV